MLIQEMIWIHEMVNINDVLSFVVPIEIINDDEFEPCITN